MEGGGRGNEEKRKKSLEAILTCTAITVDSLNICSAFRKHSICNDASWQLFSTMSAIHAAETDLAYALHPC